MGDLILKSGSYLRRKLFICFLLISVGWNLNLDSLYQLAEPGEGYDKLLVLDSFQVYEGGFIAQTGKKSGVKGYGAIIDLSLGSIRQIKAVGNTTSLDIERCVIINGGDSIAAVSYNDAASGILNHLTILNSFNGVDFWYGARLTVKNSIIVKNQNSGVLTNDSCLSMLSISYNNCWRNLVANYYCWFGSC